MRFRTPKTSLALVLVLGMLVTSVGFGVFGAPRSAHANNPAATAAGLAIDAVIVGLQAAIAADQPIAGGQAGSAAARTAEETGERVIDPIFVTVVREVFMNMLSFVSNRLAYDAAVALSSGGKGQTGLVDFQSPEAYFKSLGLDVLGETIESLDDALSTALNTDFELCAPQDPIARLSLQIGLKNAYSRQDVEPRCDFQDFLNNRAALFGRFSGQEGGSQNILRRFARAYNPGQNELDASIALNLGVHQQISLKKEIGLDERFANEGFKDVVDAITGQITTPAALIRQQSEYAIGLARNEYTKDLALSVLNDQEALKQMGLSAISVFANTLLSNLSNNIFSGLFNPPDLRDVDPFNPQSVVQGGRERAQETFRSILSAPIISFDDYNIINEFVICPGDDLRGLNNCVMDQPFATAVSRAQAGEPLTVQQALEEGFLHGGWPLIPSSDEGRNQDPRCHTYGYCYANLVKLRKARILPIGWELAANSVFNGEASPATLQEVVDGFFDCNEQNQADSNHPWCHLIDPNWVLKSPAAQCRAFVPGELPVSGLVNARQSVCVDAPTCIAQDDEGACVGGYGYCTQETNVWQFRGDSCPAAYAGCLAFNNVRSGESAQYLLNTVDTDGCGADNAGCRWYRTNKFLSAGGTTSVETFTEEEVVTGELLSNRSFETTEGGGTVVTEHLANGAFEPSSSFILAEWTTLFGDLGLVGGLEGIGVTTGASGIITPTDTMLFEADKVYTFSVYARSSSPSEFIITYPFSPDTIDYESSATCRTPIATTSAWTQYFCDFSTSVDVTGRVFLTPPSGGVIFDSASLTTTEDVASTAVANWTNASQRFSSPYHGAATIAPSGSVTQSVGVEVGNTYILSVYAKAETTAGIGSSFWIDHGLPSSQIASESPECGVPGVFSVEGVGTWVRAECVFSPSVNTTATIALNATSNISFDYSSLLRVETFIESDELSGATGLSYAFLPEGETYVLEERDDDIQTASSVRPSYTYSDVLPGYARYAYEDRIYLDQEVGMCTESAAGCTELISGDNARLNMIRNPGFEDDEDEDGQPDGWEMFLGTPAYEQGGGAFEGLASLSTKDVSTAIGFRQENILLQPSRFYTFSLHAKTDALGSGSPNRSATLNLEPAQRSGTIDLSGTSVLGDCSLGPAPFNVLTMTLEPDADGYDRFACTFTTPDEPVLLRVSITDNAGLVSGGSDETFYDALQLEIGSVPSSFQEGYGTDAVARTYLRLPPSWLGCTGAPTDPVACGDYTQICQAQDVGCDLYTPTAGGFNIPAVTSAADTCPSECVGYETYQQEATPYESKKFPLFFIADSAAQCTQADVGCDAYTNLNEVALGGEGTEYYTALRFCAQPEQDTGSTYYTWEGTESEGFQLRAWQLLESDLSDVQTTRYEDSTIKSKTFVGAAEVFEEAAVGLAPCTNPVVTSDSTVICSDAARGTVETDTFSTCDDRSDVFTNPDCREFYDSDGNIHYRELSKTAVISDACAPYRRNEATESDCTASGGFWTEGGTCRYFALAEESRSCSEAAAGCRAYTGASGRNATTLFTDTFEDGSLNEYDRPDVELSDDSLAAGGHSVFVPSALETLRLVEGSSTTEVNGVAGGQCEAGEICTLLDLSSLAGCEVVGTDQDDVDACGPLVGKLQNGKTYILEFWAHAEGAEGSLTAYFSQPGVGAFAFVSGSLPITGTWQRYSLGPLTITSPDFDDEATLIIASSSGDGFFLDNMTLKETEENLALIKDSWVTPGSCDVSPTGVPSPQHYLGCQAYTDGAGAEQSLYQFTRLCREEVVGCSAYFDTQNSESVFGEVFNATCSRPASAAPPTGPQACTMGGETVCTIATGRSSCHFSLEGALPNPLPSSPFVISLGPEARVVPGDSDLFLVDRGTTSCGAAVAGCTEVGSPVFNQAKTEVTGFESTFIIDDPDQYASILCDTEGLFCEAWSTGSDGTFYFKDPGEKTCGFRSSVTLNNQTYSGWFRTGTNDPCDYVDTNGNGRFDASNEDELLSAYLVSGVEFGIWRNGDVGAGQYDGWVGTCPERYDRCSEFVDVMDTSGGLQPAGTPYVYLKNEKIEEAAQSSAERCNGQVSLDAGCALFNDTSRPDKTWNASASYIASTHADILFGDAGQSLQSPMSCAGSNPSNDIGQITAPSGTVFNLCQSRCRYTPPAGGEIDHPYAVSGTTGAFYTGSCLMDTDCPTVVDSNKETVSGRCVQVYDDTPTGLQAPYDGGMGYLTIDFNDVNDIRRVHRDRACSEWLTCSSTIRVWDERTGRFREVCDQVGACTQYAQVGDATVCSAFADATPTPLSSSAYIDRDISWWGEEFSGYSIPNHIPTELLDQVNINPPLGCSGAPNVSCTLATSDEDCEDPGLGVCQEFPEDIRLAYNASACVSEGAELGAACYVGTCSISGDPCSQNNECAVDAGEFCSVGHCEYTQTGTTCEFNDDCAEGFTCQNNLCKDTTNVPCSPENAVTVCSAAPVGVSGQCVLEPTSFKGACYNEQCLVSPDGTPFSPTVKNTVECKAYPEQNSPYPHQVWGDEDGDPTPTGIVTNWVDPLSPTDPIAYNGLAGAEPDESQDWTVYTKRPGFQGVSTCAPNGEDCSCTYQKVSYGDGIATRYYGRNVQDIEFLEGVCLGGEREGLQCAADSECNVETSSITGRCVRPTSVEKLLGVDGYCLERDTAMNKWRDANNTFGGECLTWYPVDQLAGSNDIYNNFTEAGAILDETGLYCTDVDIFVDYYPTGSYDHGLESGSVSLIEGEISCAETQHGGPYGLTCRPGDYDACAENAHCPENYFAVLGACESTGGVCDAPAFQDDDCPYFCVPENSFDPFVEDEDEAFDRCARPSGVDSGQTISTGSSQEPDWNTQVYMVDSLDDEGLDPGFGVSSWAERYGRCVKRGLPSNATGVDAWNDDYAAFYANSLHGWNRGGTSNAREFYLGCTEVAITSDPTGLFGGPGNKAWTDRLWVGQPDPYALAGLNYTALTEPDTPAGRVTAGDVEIGSDGLQFSGAIGGYDQFPFPVATCQVDNTLYAADEDPGSGLVCTSLGGTQSLYSPAGTGVFYGRVYADTVAVVSGPPPTFPTCSDAASCNTAFTCDMAEDNLSCHVSCDPSVGGACSFDTDGDGENDLDLGACEFDETTDNYFCATATAGSCADNDWTPGGVPGQRTLGLCSGGGARDGGLCHDDGANDYDCWSIACQQIDGTGYCVEDFVDSWEPFIDPATVTDSATVFANHLSQFFAKYFKVLNYNYNGGETKGRYEDLIDTPEDLSEDPSVIPGSTGNDGTPPVVRGLGDCFAAGCREDVEPNTITVNGVTSGAILDDGGAAHVSVQFFAEANANQLPIRNVIVNWGDGHQSGSTGEENYYKNHRGLLPEEQTKDYCGEQTKWGETSDSCEPNYFTFTHDYVCNDLVLSELNDCGSGADESDGCKEADTCVFVPRVHVKDNWGYCTGVCGDADGAASVAGTLCYDNTGGVPSKNECHLECDSGASDIGCDAVLGQTNPIDPWVYFGGEVRVES